MDGESTEERLVLVNMRTPTTHYRFIFSKPSDTQEELQSPILKLEGEVSQKGNTENAEPKAACETERLCSERDLTTVKGKETLLETPRRNPSLSLKRQSSSSTDPPKLSDGHFPRFVDWLYLMERNFKINADRFGTADSRLDYLLGRVAGEARELLIARMRRTCLAPITDVKDALEYLKMVYGEPHAELTAWKHFLELQMQEGQKFRRFFKKFMLLALESGTPEKSLVPHLCDKLPPRLRKDAARLFSYADRDFVQFSKDCSRLADTLDSEDDSEAG